MVDELQTNTPFQPLWGYESTRHNHELGKFYCPACHEAALLSLHDYSYLMGFDMTCKHLIFCDTIEQASTLAEHHKWNHMEWRWLSVARQLAWYPDATVHIPDIPIERPDHDEFINNMVNAGRRFLIGEQTELE